MRRLHAALQADEPLHWAVFGRVAFGAIFLLCTLQFMPHLLPLFGADGLMGPASLERVFGASQGGLLHLQVALPDGAIVALYVALLASALAFLLGFRTRTAGVLLLVLHGLFWGRQPLVYSGWPHAAQCFVAYLILADAGRYGSLDARRAGRQGVGVGPAWPRRLFQVHLSLLYLSIGLPRLVDGAWLGGLMVYAALTYDRYARFAVDWQPWLGPLHLLDWATLCLEPLAGLLLWWKRARAPLIVALVGLHGGLELLTRTGWWQFVMVAALLAFTPQPWLESAWARLRDPVGRSRSFPGRNARGVH